MVYHPFSRLPGRSLEKKNPVARNAARRADPSVHPFPLPCSGLASSLPLHGELCSTLTLAS